MRRQKFLLRAVLVLWGAGVFFSSLSTVFGLEETVQEMMLEQAKDYHKKGLFAQKIADYQGAINNYRKSLYVNPSNAAAHNNIGVIFIQVGDTIQAQKEFEMAIAIDPQYVPSLKNLAILYAEKGDLEKSYYYWKRATGMDRYTAYVVDDEGKERLVNAPPTTR